MTRLTQSLFALLIILVIGIAAMNWIGSGIKTLNERTSKAISGAVKR